MIIRSGIRVVSLVADEKTGINNPFAKEGENFEASRAKRKIHVIRGWRHRRPVRRTEPRGVPSCCIAAIAFFVFGICCSPENVSIPRKELFSNDGGGGKTKRTKQTASTSTLSYSSESHLMSSVIRLAVTIVTKNARVVALALHAAPNKVTLMELIRADFERFRERINALF